MRKLIVTQKDFVVSDLPTAGDNPDKIQIRHRATDKISTGVMYQEVLDDLLLKLSDYYGWAVVFRDSV